MISYDRDEYERLKELSKEVIEKVEDSHRNNTRDYKIKHLATMKTCHESKVNDLDEKINKNFSIQIITFIISVFIGNVGSDALLSIISTIIGIDNKWISALFTALGATLIWLLIQLLLNLVNKHKQSELSQHKDMVKAINIAIFFYNGKFE